MKTNLFFSFIWIECWKYEPAERPDMQNVVSILRNIVSSKQNDISIDRVIEEREIISESSKIIVDHNDLITNKISRI